MRNDEPALSVAERPVLARVEDFDSLVTDWSALTYVLNNLTRGLGLADAYPFVLSTAVIDKLRFVCTTMVRNAAAGSEAADMGLGNAPLAALG
jgi:hypothetical protein